MIFHFTSSMPSCVATACRFSLHFAACFSSSSMPQISRSSPLRISSSVLPSALQDKMYLRTTPMRILPSPQEFSSTLCPYKCSLYSTALSSSSTYSSGVNILQLLAMVRPFAYFITPSISNLEVEVQHLLSSLLFIEKICCMLLFYPFPCHPSIYFDLLSKTNIINIPN